MTNFRVHYRLTSGEFGKFNVKASDHHRAIITVEEHLHKEGLAYHAVLAVIPGGKNA